MFQLISAHSLSPARSVRWAHRTPAALLKKPKAINQNLVANLVQLPRNEVNSKDGAGNKERDCRPSKHIREERFHLWCALV